MFRSPRARLLAATTISIGLLTQSRAQAQSTEQMIGSIEKQIHELQSQLRAVQKDLAARKAQVREAQQQAREAKQQAAAAAAAQQAQQTREQAEFAARGAQPVQLNTAGANAAAAGAPNTAVVMAQTEPKLPPGAMLVTSRGHGQFTLGGVTVTLGGFIEAAGIFRSRNETSDIASSFSGIPLPNLPGYNQNETRFSARQSRVSLMAQANPNPVTTLTAYIETDFLGTGPTANSNESNSYTLRLRHAYAEYDRSDYDFHVLGGQTWSLLTLFQKGMTVRQEAIPYTIDAQYVPGFTWKRQPGYRMWKGFDDGEFHIGLSVENPQSSFYAGGASAGTGTTATSSAIPGDSVVYGYAGGSALTPTVNYSNDPAPDIIAKATWDPSFGHFEAYGLLRFIRDAVDKVGGASNQTVPAGGGGVGMFVPILGKKLILQASSLVGSGIGLYGSSQLPDAIIGPTGKPVAIPEVMGLVGLISFPTPALQLYAYGGTEQESSRYFSAGHNNYGYGNPLYAEGGCNVLLDPASSCTGNTSGVTQGTVGYWWRFFQGAYGTFMFGMQYSYTERNVFKGVGLTPGTSATPSTNDNMVFTSLRYYPFQ